MESNYRATKSNFNIRPVNDELKTTKKNSMNNGNNYHEDRLRFLENENEELRKQLSEALKELQLLRQENMSMKQQAPLNSRPSTAASKKKSSTTVVKEEIPVTAAATVICDNCDKEIDKKNYELHVIYCKKNITKCSFCKERVDLRELDEHISSLRGTETEIDEVIQTGNLPRLKQMVEHGFDLINYVNVGDKHNTLMHYSALHDQKEIIEYLHHRGININEQNKDGETPLHLCTKHKGSLSLAKMLLHLGADLLIKNKLGDTVESIAMRHGKQDLAMYFSQYRNSGGGSRASLMSRGSARIVL